MKSRAIAFLVAVTSFALFTPQARALDIKRVELSNGAVMLVSEQHQLPMITMIVAFDAGSRRDPVDKHGLAFLTAESLTEGTKELTAEQFNQKVDFMGSEVGIDAGQDYTHASCTSLKKYWPDTLHLLATVLTQPALKDDDILRKRGEQIASLKSANEQPGHVAGEAFLKDLFASEPYGHLPMGTVESAEKLTTEDVRGFYHQFYRPEHAIIAVVGDISADEAKSAIEKELSSMKGAVPSQPEPAAISVPPGIHLHKIDRNITQATLLLGFQGIARSNPDYYRLQVGNYILGGGGFASRLVRTVRSKAGLAYSIHSGFEPGKFPGSFQVGLETKNKSANDAIKLVLEQLKEIQQKPVSEAEIKSAKRFLVGSFPLKLDRQGSIASFLVQIEFYGLGLDYADRYPSLINSVTRDDVLRVMREYLHPDSMIVVAVANQNEAGIDIPGAQPIATEAAAPSSTSAATPGTSANEAATPAASASAAPSPAETPTGH